MEQKRLLITSSCPNCGAPVDNDSFQCEYCGSKFARIGIISTSTGDINHAINSMIQENLELSKCLVAQSLQRQILTANEARNLFGFKAK